MTPNPTKPGTNYGAEVVDTSSGRSLQCVLAGDLEKGANSLELIRAELPGGAGHCTEDMHGRVNDLPEVYCVPRRDARACYVAESYVADREQGGENK